MMKFEPQQEHAWLKRLVGDWTMEGEALMGPDQPPMKSKGTESVRAIGDAWILGEGKGEMPDGSAATMLLTLGYDPQKKRFVGTWVGSMMGHLWVYDGELDVARRVLTLNAEGPNMTGDGMAHYQDIITMESDDHRILTSRVKNADGTWTQFMTAHYRRAR